VEYLARQLNGNTNTNEMKDVATSTATTNNNTNNDNNDNASNKSSNKNDGGNADAGVRQMHVQSVAGVEWGLFVLMGGQEKAPCYTSHYHYILYAVRGRAYLTLGDGYKVPCTDALLAEGFVAEVPRGNHFGLKNADAALHATFLYYRIRAAGRGGGGG
jgi:hypothetical protein